MIVKPALTVSMTYCQMTTGQGGWPLTIVMTPEGLGAAYSTQFGEPIPLPVLLFDWNNGRKLSWLTILPVSSELWYAHSDRAHYGMLLHVRGNRFQGDPERYDVEDPQLQYSVVTFGPSARFALANRLMLQVDAGMVPYRRFEFFNGTTKADSFNLKESAYARLGFSYDF